RTRQVAERAGALIDGEPSESTLDIQRGINVLRLRINGQVRRPLLAEISAGIAGADWHHKRTARGRRKRSISLTDRVPCDRPFSIQLGCDVQVPPFGIDRNAPRAHKNDSKTWHWFQ